MKWISRLYIFFLGIILTITTGFGIAAFYPEPVRPMYPITRPAIIPESCIKTPEAAESEACKKYFENDQTAEKLAQDAYQQEMQEFENINAAYRRTAIFLGVAIGTLFVIIGLAVLKTSSLLANGLLLAGVLTAIMTRLLISLASLGANVSGTEGPNVLGIVEFIILLVLSTAVIFVGKSSLKS